MYDLCPREWTVNEIDPIQSMQDLVVTKYEYAYFAEIARAWNQFAPVVGIVSRFPAPRLFASRPAPDTERRTGAATEEQEHRRGPPWSRMNRP